MGAPKRSMPRPTRRQTDLIEQAVARGWDVPLIAARLGIHPVVVQAVVDEQDQAAAEQPTMHIDAAVRPGQPPHRKSQDCWCRPTVVADTDTTVIRHTGLPRRAVRDSIRHERGYDAHRGHVPPRAARATRNEP